MSNADLHIEVDRTGSFLYVAPVFSQGSLGIAVYDISTATLLKHLPFQTLSTLSMTLTLDGKFLVVDRIPQDPVTRLNDFPTLTVIDTGTFTVVREFPWTGPRNIPLTVKRVIALPGLPITPN